jgi:UDP-glucose 4-epimerase
VVEQDDNGERGVKKEARRPSARARPAFADEGLAHTHGGGQAVLITGICGRLGRLLARRLHRGDRVIGIDTRPFEGKPEDILYYQLDLRRKKTQEVFRAGEIRAVIHLGIMHDPRQSDSERYSWNLGGFQTLLEYVARYRIPKLVLLSSANVYGPRPENPHFLTEEMPLLGAQDFPQIRDLVEVDMLAQSFFWKMPAIETVILRPCHILGRVRNAPSNYLRMQYPVTLMGFDPIFQVIHERDVVSAVVLSLASGTRGIYNLGGSGEMRLSGILRLLGKTAVSVPGFLAKTVLGRLWPYGASNYPPAALDYLRFICMVDDKRARDQLGFMPAYSLEATLNAIYTEI